MKKSKKKYLAFLDIAITEIVGQRLQTILAKDYAKKINGDVIFYSTETYCYEHNSTELRASWLLVSISVENKFVAFLRL